MSSHQLPSQQAYDRTTPSSPVPHKNKMLGSQQVYVHCVQDQVSDCQTSFTSLNMCLKKRKKQQHINTYEYIMQVYEYSIFFNSKCSRQAPLPHLALLRPGSCLSTRCISEILLPREWMQRAIVSTHSKLFCRRAWKILVRLEYFEITRENFWRAIKIDISEACDLSFSRFCNFLFIRCCQ